jgi:transcriptional regulator with XRE-family HTH domain
VPRKNNIDKAVGVALRTARLAKGLTQETLALDAGVDRSYVSLIELGKNSPSVRMLIQLCGGLDLVPSVFMADVERLISDNGMNDK